MSQIETPDIVLEWSPDEVRAYWPGTGDTRTGATISDAVNGRTRGKALVMISRRASFVRATNLPNVGGRDLQMLIRNALPGLVPLPPGELAYDVMQTGEISQQGRLVVLGAVLNPYLMRLNAEAKAAGLTIGAVVPAGFSAVTIAHKVGLRDAAVVEETAGGLNIDLIAGGILRYSRLAMPAGSLDDEVARTYSAAGLQPASVIVAGGSKLEGSYSSSLGSLKAAAEIDLRHPPINIELLSAVEKRLAEEINGRRRIAGLLLAASIAFAAFAFVTRSDDYSKVAKANDQANKELATYQAKAKYAESEVDKVLPIQQTVYRGFQPAQPLLDVLRTFIKYVPSQGMWLAGVTLERGKPFTIKGSSLSSPLVTSYLKSLEADPRLRDVKLLGATDTVIQNQQVVQFSIQGFPVGNLPLVDPVKPGSKPSGSSSTTSTTTASKGGA